MALFLTKAGLAALVEAEESGTKLQATHMALGDGNGSVPEHTTSSPSLINEVWRGALQSITINEQGDTDAGKQVVFEAHVPINAGGWYIREVALYAGGVLLAIGTHPVMWKPAPEEPTKMEHVIKAPVTFSNADSVSLIVDPAVVLASQQFVNNKISEHNVAETAHADLRKLFGGHNHDEEYYTQAQVDALLSAKHIVPVGHIYPVPFPLNELPEHHYFPNGEGLLKTSGAGKTLLSMSFAYKTAHHVTENATHVFLPNVFDEEGRGYFPRFVDGQTRLVGSTEGSASPNISGILSLSDQTNTHCRIRVIEATGAFQGRLESGPTAGFHAAVNLNNIFRSATFEASRSSEVYCGTNEVRSSNYGFTPAIYLPPLEA